MEAGGRTAKYAQTDAVERAYRVVVEAGRDGGATWVMSLDGAERALVGTSPSCQLRLSDPHVSRRHLVFEPTNGGVLVIDVGSTNGTIVQGVKIREAIADVGARIRIGDTILRIEDAKDERAEPIAEADSFGRMVGKSLASRRVFALGHRLAAANIPVVVEGETGTGKTLFAEALHEASPRASGPFVIHDAASQPASKAAEALFGRAALVAQARNGTLVIGEPAELPGDVQRRLVRLVERGDAVLEGPAPEPCDVRLVVTSRANLDAAVEDGRLREDFYALFANARIWVAPLRKRPEDIDVLARYFWAEFKGPGEIPADLLERLRADGWPGNVRELERTVARYVAAGAPAPVGRSDEPSGGFIERLLEQDLPVTQAREKLIDYFERRYVERVLRRHENVTQAAAAAGLAQRYFRSLKAKYGYGSK